MPKRTRRTHAAGLKAKVALAALREDKTLVELAKGFGPLFSSDSSAAYKQATKARIYLRLDFLNLHLASAQYLQGDQFSAADAYLYAVQVAYARSRSKSATGRNWRYFVNGFVRDHRCKR